MRLCSRHNHSLNIILWLPQQSDLLYWTKDWHFKGPYAKYFYETFFLDDQEHIRKKWPNSCKFFNRPLLGVRTPENGSYTGAIGVIADKKADFISRPLEYLIDPKFVDFTQPLVSLNFFTLQFIKAEIAIKNDKLADLLDFLIPSFSFIVLVAMSMLIYFTSLILVSHFNKILLKKSRQNLQRKILVFFCILFLFFIYSLLNGNLSTKNTIVDASILLNTRDDIIRSRRECCFPENSQELDYFVKASKGSFASKIWEKRNVDDLCCVNDENSRMGNILKRKLDRIFLIVYDANLDILGKMFQTMIRTDMFVSQDIIYESVRAIIMRRGVSKVVRDFIEACASAQGTFGFVKRTLSSMPNYTGLALPKTGGKDGLMIFHSLNEFIEYYTMIEPISLRKMNILFRIYFSCLVIVFIAFLIHHNYKRTFHSLHIALNTSVTRILPVFH